MKKNLLLFFFIISYLSYGQDILMQNGTFTASSGILYDSGGEFSNYANNESFIITICPEEIGQRARLDFQQFDTQLNADILTVYDGNDVSAPSLGVYSGVYSPGSVIATFDNPTGCLTVQFISNDLVNAIGWAAEISSTTPCQDITAQLDSTFPVANPEGVIEVCVGDNINISGSGIFETNGSGANYTWDLGDGNIAYGQTVNVSYDMPGVYLVNLDIRDTNTDNIIQGCPNTNSINLVIRVSGEPDFSGTEAVDHVLCFGESTTLEGVVSPLTLVYNCPPPESEVTFLPDGNGAAYSTSINVTCFGDEQVLTDVSQIESICLNMEHSYIGDLDIEIVSPNGQVVRLHDQGGGSANFGIPWATGTVDGNSADTTPGVGFDYCFVPNGGFPTLVDGIEDDGSFPNGDDAATYLDYFVPAGNYSSVNPLDGLLGSPLNGNWTIRVVDNISADNGYMFSWELNFDPSLQLQDFDYVPSIVSQVWDLDATITEVNGNIITVTPDAAGEFCYTFRTLDAFGCEHTKTVCVNVAEEGATMLTYYEDSDDDGYGDTNSSITVSCNDNTGRPIGYVLNNLDCNDLDEDINPDATDDEGNNVDENCDGVDGYLLSITDIDVNDINIFPNPFKDHVTLNVPTILLGTELSINIYDLKGRLVYKNTKTSASNEITIGNLEVLERATYFLELYNEDLGFKVVKKLIRL
ncbi:PKD domain-containing protein [Winogradskyella ludwigii]|uniref:PKD domain-containing protein n=1 Tax=Winogradskyella ludwigii TaxID=2686076 RepID=UPI0015C94EE9|nr:PKD domain-containing protein [Winogradskyella ludwigii]